MTHEKQRQGLYIKNLLDFKSDFVNFKLQFMLEDMFYHYRLLASEKFLECFLVMPDSLKKTYKADPIKIEYIISTLLAYCVEQSDKGRIDILVNQRQQYGNMVELCFIIQNTGNGKKLETTEIKNQYEANLSLDSLASNDLDKVFQMAKYIGGTINLKSSGYQQGVQFNFILPMEMVS